MFLFVPIQKLKTITLFYKATLKVIKILAVKIRVVLKTHQIYGDNFHKVENIWGNTHFQSGSPWFILKEVRCQTKHGKRFSLKNMVVVNTMFTFYQDILWKNQFGFNIQIVHFCLLLVYSSLSIIMR